MAAAYEDIFEEGVSGRERETIMRWVELVQACLPATAQGDERRTTLDVIRRVLRQWVNPTASGPPDAPTTDDSLDGVLPTIPHPRKGIPWPATLSTSDSTTSIPAQYGGWDGRLQGCLNDATSMRALAEAAGFTSTSVLDEAATAAGVTAAIGALAGAKAPGDLCLISYSGHGGQVADEDGDEDDGQDETWVCFDRQLLDDELHLAWTRFPSGMRVLVISDSCHSGSVVRDEVDRPLTRGMPDEQQTRDNLARSAAYRAIKQQVAARGDLEVGASVLLISGCQDDEVSYDGQGNGAFTQSLLQTWAEGAFVGDYAAFHADIVANMTTDQTPNLNSELVADPDYLTQQPFTV